MHCWAYMFLAFIRVLLTLLPQTGYIHPDEFFQSTEVLAGESLYSKSNINLVTKDLFRASTRPGDVHTVGV